MAACSVCDHDQLAEIDAALAGGASRNEVARRFGVHSASVQRHRAAHLSPALVATAKAEAEGQRYRSLLDRIEDLVETIEGVMASAKEEGRPSAILAAARELRAGLELLGKATGELKPDGSVTVINLATSPEFLEVRRIILDALAPFPEASIAVARALTVDAYKTKELGP